MPQTWDSSQCIQKIRNRLFLIFFRLNLKLAVVWPARDFLASPSPPFMKFESAKWKLNRAALSKKKKVFCFFSNKKSLLCHQNWSSPPACHLFSTFLPFRKKQFFFFPSLCVHHKIINCAMRRYNIFFCLLASSLMS